MNEALLEEMETIAKDTRKVFEYNKYTGEWAWRNKDEFHSYGGFKTRLDALKDAVGIYLEDSE